MKTMKTKNIFKLLATMAVLLFTVNVVSAQIGADYVQYDSTAAAPDSIDYLTLKTGGTTMGYYALPDPIYHPNYNVGGGWVLSPLFIWNWSFYLQPAGVAPSSAKPGDANYVEITYRELGSYRLDVLEQASAAFGGCTSADTTRIYVELIAPPTAQFATGLGNGAVCGNLAAQGLIVEFTENVPADLARYAFRISEVVENIDNDDVVIGAVLSTNDNFVNYAITPAAKVAPNGGTSPNFTLSGINTSAMTVQTNLRTRYTYTLTSAATVSGTGVVSAISHKSDYLAGAVNGHAFGTRTSVVFILNPAPVTGPIYHIPNNFRF